MASTRAQIRRANEGDCVAIAGLIAALRLQEQGRTIDHARIVSTLALAVSQPASAVFVAETDGAVVGFVVVHWIPFAMLEGTEAYVSDLIVAAELRGGGIGRQLVQSVETEATSRGCVRIMLNNRVTTESFQRGFYLKLGFRRREEFANFVKVLR